MEITIHEGRKRQIKRMCAEVGHRVIQLERIRFGPLVLGGLQAGAYRRLTANEINYIIYYCLVNKSHNNITIIRKAIIKNHTIVI